MGLFKGLFLLFELVDHELDVVLKGLYLVGPFEGFVVLKGYFFLHECLG